MYQKVLTVILLFSAFLFVGFGITGFASLNGGSLCQVDSDCSYAVCCPLQGEDYGVCDQESRCADLYFSSAAVISAQQAPLMEQQAERSYIAIALGVLLLFILAVVGYLEWKQERSLKRSLRRSKK